MHSMSQCHSCRHQSVTDRCQEHRIIRDKRARDRESQGVKTSETRGWVTVSQGVKTLDLVVHLTWANVVSHYCSPKPAGPLEQSYIPTANLHSACYFFQHQCCRDQALNKYNEWSTIASQLKLSSAQMTNLPCHHCGGLQLQILKMCSIFFPPFSLFFTFFHFFHFFFTFFHFYFWMI